MIRSIRYYSYHCSAQYNCLIRMRSYLKYISLLVPLAVLLSLPCATKRQIKQSTTTQETHMTANKGEGAKLCTSSFVDENQIQYSIKQKVSDSPLVALASAESAIPLLSVIREKIDFRNLSQKKPTIPLFLLYSKLIIYF